MYPFVRMAYHIAKASAKGPIGLFDEHVSDHRIWPWDLDPWVELNNGRTLTLYDIGRLALINRIGLGKAARLAGLYTTVGGVSVRYRLRITPMASVRMRSRLLGFDNRFIYFDQSLWLGEECANQVLVRNALARRGKGLVPPPEAAKAMGLEVASPELPAWVRNWIDAEATRIWPPDLPQIKG